MLRVQQLVQAARPGMLLGAGGLATVAGPPHHEGLGERVRHVAEDVVHKVAEVVHNVEHKAEEVVHKVEDEVHRRREIAHEEAERGMFTSLQANLMHRRFTADDITEAAEQMKRAREHRKPREYRPDEEEALLEEASSGAGHAERFQRAMQDLTAPEEGQAPARRGPAGRGAEEEAEEALLEEASSDLASKERQKELEGLRRTVKEE